MNRVREEYVLYVDGGVLWLVVYEWSVVDFLRVFLVNGFSIDYDDDRVVRILVDLEKAIWVLERYDNLIREGVNIKYYLELC